MTKKENDGLAVLPARGKSATRPAASRDRSTPAKPQAALKPANDSQSIHRAFALLRIVANARADGIRLTEVAEASKLHVATAHRLLAALVRERFVTLDPYTRLYHMGFEAMLLAEGAREYRIKRHFREALAELARDTEDTVYLSTPSGNDSICIDRVEGPYPIRTITLDVGARRPLGVGGGSLALLAWLPAARVESIITACAPRYAQYKNLTADEVRALVRASIKRGYAFNDGRIIDGVCAVSVPALDASGEAVAAISVAAIAQRMRPERRKTIVEAIRRVLASAGLPENGQ